MSYTRSTWWAAAKASAFDRVRFATPASVRPANASEAAIWLAMTPHPMTAQRNSGAVKMSVGNGLSATAAKAACAAAAASSGAAV